jgi:integrase
VDIPVTPELQAAIDAMPRAPLTFIVTATGKPRSKYALGNDFAKWAREAGLPDHCRLHGLKKAGMARLADAGNTSHELMAISGHKTLSMVELYTRGSNNRKLAGSGMVKRTKGAAEPTNQAASSYKPSANLLK